MTCTRAQEFLAREKVTPESLVEARNTKINRDGAIALARQAKHVWSMKGTKVVHLDLNEKVSDDELAAVLLGPNGTLRAPALHVDDSFVVGFNETVYKQVFAKQAVKAR